MSTKKIATFEAACKALKLDPKKCLPVVTGMPKKHQEAIIANAKLVIITEALNEGWTPDWNNNSECKYWPWFYVKATNKKPSGVGLSYLDAVNWNTSSFVGSRLCFKSKELAEYAGKQFIKIYEAAYLLP